MLQEVRVPDIGDFKDVPIIQILVAVGDAIKAEDPLVVLESDKATIEVPSPMAGIVRKLEAAVGDRISKGGLLLSLEDSNAGRGDTQTRGAPVAAPVTGRTEPARAAKAVTAPTPQSEPTPGMRAAPSTAAAREPALAAPASTDVSKIVDFGAATSGTNTRIHAGPSVRALARRMGVDLTKVRGSGRTRRIMPEDVHAYVKAVIEAPRSVEAPSAQAPERSAAPRIDFARFGPVNRQPLSRIQKISGSRLADNWARIPHVTNFDEADITDLEAFRIQSNTERGATGPKLSVLPFLIKACTHVLKKHPRLNSSLDEGELVFKGYFHVGFAADTPDGLLVPVIRDADKKGIDEIAAEAAGLAARARERSLKPADMEGGCFTISSLGGIGGSGFTPIINAPEAAILGVGRAAMRPTWDGEKFLPRLILPMALSWDHRIIDGALAARFLVDLAALLRDLRRALL